MSNLYTLKPRLTDLDWTIQLELHERIRISRLVSKAPKTKTAAKRREKRVNVRSNLAKITPEEAKKLLELIEKKGI